MCDYTQQVSSLIGIPFVPGGRDILRDGGLDCWGLVIEAYSIISPDIILPEVNISCRDEESFDINEKAFMDKDTYGERFTFDCPEIPCPSVMMIKHADPIYINHVGVYLGGRKFIHTRVKVGVSIDSIDSPAWKRKIEGFYLPVYKRS